MYFGHKNHSFKVLDFQQRSVVIYNPLLYLLNTYNDWFDIFVNLVRPIRVQSKFLKRGSIGGQV